MNNDTDILIINKRIENHKESLLSFMNDKPINFINKLIEFKNTFEKINYGFTQGKINFNVVDVDNIGVLEFELYLSLSLLNHESTLTGGQFLRVEETIKDLLEEIALFKSNINSFIIPTVSAFNITDITTDEATPTSILGGFI